MVLRLSATFWVLKIFVLAPHCVIFLSLPICYRCAYAIRARLLELLVLWSAPCFAQMDVQVMSIMQGLAVVDGVSSGLNGQG